VAASGLLPKGVSKRKLIAFYVVLAIATAAVTAVVISIGKDESALPSFAGGYDAEASNACLGATPSPSKGRPLPKTAPTQPAVPGPSFDVKQSGRFVNLSNAAGTLGAKLELDETARPDGSYHLSGDVDCVNGKKLAIDAVAVSGPSGKISGKLGGDSFIADLKRDPPDPGAAKPRAPGSIAGVYKLSPRSTCFGGSLELKGGGSSYGIHAKKQSLGKIAYNKDTGKLTGDVSCARGGSARLTGLAVDRQINNLQLIPLDLAAPAKNAKPGKAPLTTPSGLPPSGEKVTATKQRKSFGATVAAFFIAVVVVMLVARLFGIAALRVGQPRVMGEVLAGICLGPTILGAISPGLQATIFSSDILPAFGTAANLGLIFYMFLVGLEIDPGQLRGRVGQAAAISNASVAVPMMLGIAVALPLFKFLGPHTKFVAFALFMGVSMSITAFPVLARILVERRMLKRPIGALTLACAAIDDVTAWFLIGLATAIAVAGSGAEVARTIGLAIAFCLLMGFLVRPLVGRVSTAYDEAGRIPAGWIVAIFAGVLLSAYTTETIGIAVIFGAFIMGLIMPRHAELTEDVTHRVEDFVVSLLLPLFFAYTGLKTNVGLLDRPVLWLVTLALIAIAIVGKLFGALIAARFVGFGWRPSFMIGTLMNTRGLTELIVLNLALEKGVLSDALFAMLVIMALVTTFMAAPLLNLIDPKREFSAPLEDELEESRRETLVEFPRVRIPERSILVAPQGENALSQLRSLAEPLAQSDPPRELILARPIKPPRGVDVRGGLQTESKLLERAAEEVNAARSELIDRGIAARAVAFISQDPGADVVRLSENEQVDLVLLDGRRPLLGDSVPRGDVGTVLRDAPCDVGVLVANERAEVLAEPRDPVVVPFGGAEHDWAALELAAWIASATGAPLRLLGASSDSGNGARVTRLLGDAGMLVQQYAGVAAEPLVAEPGRGAVIQAAGDAGLLVIGLSDRWRREGLGATRSEIARHAPAPVLFVRRGRRPGALAPRADVTRFSWSAAGAGDAPGPSPTTAA
jgi:Kef-type K+ transport system membrane component KefB/nucleotide-binding universal stress UspA family protein